MQHCQIECLKMRVLYSPIGPSLDLEHVPTSYSFLITSSSSFNFFFLFFFSLSLSLSLGNYLGSGQFGEVYRGVWLGPKGNLDAAIKTLREDAPMEDKVRFLQEAAIMGQFSHPNVVALYGVVVKDNKVRRPLWGKSCSTQERLSFEWDEAMKDIILWY